MLRRPEGATVDEVARATGWQRHTVRGVFSGALKKKLGLTLASAKEERGRVYRVDRPASAWRAPVSRACRQLSWIVPHHRRSLASNLPAQSSQFPLTERLARMLTLRSVRTRSRHNQRSYYWRARFARHH